MLVERQSMANESFNGMSLRQFTAVESIFRDCDFSNICMEQACFGGGRHQSLYVNCNFDGAKFDSIVPGDARFEACSFRNVKIKAFNCISVELINCIFSGVIKKGFFNGTPFGAHPPSRKSNEFRGNDFSGASLLDVDFRTGIDLRLQRLPVGEDYIYVEGGAQFVRSLPSKDLIAKYGSHFNAIERILTEAVATGQQQIFLSIKGFPASRRPMLMGLKRLAEGMLLA